MKVDRSSVPFTPITITLETPSEVNAFLNVTEEARRSVRPKFHNDTHNNLTEFSRSEYEEILNFSVELHNEVCLKMR